MRGCEKGRGVGARIVLMCALLAAVTALAPRAEASPKARKAVRAPTAPSTAPAAPARGAFAPQAPYTAALLVDRDSGQVLFAKNEHLRWPPASMTKMMTLLIAMERIRAGDLRLDDTVVASAWASKIGGSQVYLKAGEQFPLSELLKAIVIASANDAAVAVAERVAGTAEAFVELMNRRAGELGLADTEYHSVHGLPPGRGQQPDLTSAADLATLGRRLATFPEIMAWAATSEAPFRDGQLQMRNTNHLVRTYPGADGLKTGFYAAAGFEVTATASRDGLHLLAVILGSPSKRGCFDEAAKLLSSGFAGYRAVAPATAGQPVGGPITVARGSVASFVGVAAGDLRLTLPRGEAADATVDVRVPAQLSAPVAKGQVVGEVVVRRGEQQLGRVEVIAPQDIASTAWWSGWF